MLYDNDILMKSKTKITLSKIMILYKNISEGFYSLYYLILKDPYDNIWWEVFGLIYEYVQLIINFIDDTVS